MLSLTVGASIAKGLFPILGAAGATFLRLGIGTVLLFAIWKPWRAGIPRQHLGTVLFFGVVLGLMNLTFYEAIARLPIGIAIALEFLGPLSVAFFLSKGRLDLLWATLALLGVALLLPLTEAQAHIDLVGVMYALAAAAFWACYILVGKKVGSVAHSGKVVAIGMLIGSLAVAPFGLLAVTQVDWTGTLVLMALAIGVLSSAIPFSLEMMALKRLDAKTFGILVSLEPALGAIAGFVYLRENITLLQCLAIGGVMTASVGSTLTARRQTKDVVLN